MNRFTQDLTVVGISGGSSLAVLMEVLEVAGAFVMLFGSIILLGLRIKIAMDERKLQKRALKQVNEQCSPAKTE